MSGHWYSLTDIFLLVNLATAHQRLHDINCVESNESISYRLTDYYVQVYRGC